MKSLMLLQRLFDDVKRQLPEHAASLERDYVTLEKRYRSEGFSFAAKTLPRLGDSVFEALEHGRFDCPMGFARSGALPRFFGGLLEVVFDKGTGVLKEGDHTLVLNELRQILYFFKKALAHARDERTLADDAKRSFVGVESDLDGYRHDHDLLLLRIAKVAWRVTSFEKLAAAHPKHGPGGVAEGLWPNQKYKHVFEELPLHNLCLYNMPFVEEHALDVRKSTASALRTSKLHAVPKTATAMRTITIEPAVNMFMQQHLNDLIRTEIKNNPFLRTSITLDDQEPSKRAALEASITGHNATVDLSAASDRLSNELVKAVFAHDRLLIEELQRFRTAWLDTGEACILLRKYAGMGNATTFPVQSIVFAFLSAESVILARGWKPTVRNIRRALSLVRVFGDDIIVPVDAYGALSTLLSAHGLKINERKSFHRSHFRESCGMDAYRGNSITPVYMRRKISNLRDPSELMSLVSTANQLWERGYYQASNFLKGLVEATHGKLPLVRKEFGGLGWNDRYGSYEPGRWSKRYQTWSIRSMRSRVVRRTDPIDGYPALLKFFTERTDSVRDLARSVIRFKTKTEWRWMLA